MLCFGNYAQSDGVCGLKMDQGNCFARHLMYFYDSEEKVCRLFLYGGCQGNGNRFETKEACESMCQGQFSPLLPSPLLSFLHFSLILSSPVLFSSLSSSLL